MFYIVGYDIMYADGSSFMGYGYLMSHLSDDKHSGMSDFFFQVMFVATASSVISGTIAERMKLWPFLIFVIILSGIIYPIQGHCTWGETLTVKVEYYKALVILPVQPLFIALVVGQL